MIWLTTIALMLSAGDVTPPAPGAEVRTCPVAPRVATSPAQPLAVRCRFECVCFRENGYRCLRYYTERCEGKACWQCQARVTARARKSCSIGSPVRRCWCKFKKL